MKIKLLMIGLFSLIAAAAFAQKGELKNAQEGYDQFDLAKGNKVLEKKADESLGNAKTAIDKASANEKTATLPQTYALKAAIYGALALKDSIPTTSAPLLATAQEALKKAKETDTKGEYKKMIGEASGYIADYYQVLGVKQYQSHKYDLAYQSFDNFRQASNDDTTALYYTALAASNAGITDPKYNQYAITNYGKLLNTKYSGNANAYSYLATLYMQGKDTVNALKTVSEGVAKFPNNATLREQDIRISLQAGKDNDVLSKLQAATASDPKNKTLFYYQGLTYSRIGDAAAEKATKTKDAAAKAALNKTAADDYVKAVESYKKAVEIDPEYFDATVNLGYYMSKPAIDTFNTAANLPANATQKQYTELRMKADAQFDLALPYLQKAVDLNPKSSDALNNLRNYYRGKYDPAHAVENKAKADDLKKQIDALK